ANRFTSAEFQKLTSAARRSDAGVCIWCPIPIPGIAIACLRGFASCCACIAGTAVSRGLHRSKRMKIFRIGAFTCSIYQMIRQNSRPAMLVDAEAYAFKTSSSYSSQFGIEIPNEAFSVSQLRTELRGRRAGVGYSALVIGISCGSGIPKRFEARSRIAFANPNQDVEPLSVMW